jgi:hypothetical protein
LYTWAKAIFVIWGYCWVFGLVVEFRCDWSGVMSAGNTSTFSVIAQTHLEMIIAVYVSNNCATFVSLKIMWIYWLEIQNSRTWLHHWFYKCHQCSTNKNTSSAEAGLRVYLIQCCTKITAVVLFRGEIRDSAHRPTFLHLALTWRWCLLPTLRPIWQQTCEWALCRHGNNDRSIQNEKMTAVFCHRYPVSRLSECLISIV